MFKEKPFLMPAIVFSVLALVFIVISSVSFVAGDETISKALVSMLHLRPMAITNATIAQIGIVLTLPAMFFAFMSIPKNSEK